MELGANCFEIYDSSELNEVLLDLYTSLNIALNSDCKFITIQPYQVFITFENGKEENLDQFIVELEKDYLEAFDLRMERDQLAQKYFEIISRDKTTIYAKIITPTRDIE